MQPEKPSRMRRARHRADERVQAFAREHHFAYCLLVAVACGLIYYGVLAFFLGIPALNEQTQVRPASALGPVFGLFFGWPAIIGCAVGNLFADMATESDPVRLGIYMLVQIVYYSVPYLAWYVIYRRQEQPYPRLDSAGKATVYILLTSFSSVLLTVMLLPVSVDNVSAAGIDEIRIFNNVLFLIYLGMPLLFLLERSPLVPIAPPFIRTPYRHRSHMNLTQRVVSGVLMAALAIITVFIVAVYWPFVVDPNYISVVGRRPPDLIASVYTYSFYFTACIFVPALILVHIIETHFTRPLEMLTGASRTLVAQLAARQGQAGQGQEGQALGTPADAAQQVEVVVRDVPVSGRGIRPRNEILELIESTNAMRRDLVGYVDELAEVTAERERTAAELEIASNIQASTVPHDFDSFVERYHLDVSSMLRPAKEVGGDFYDVFDAAEHKVGFIVADVSGKGVPAALFMMRALAEIREQMTFRGDVGEAMTLANRKLCEHNDTMLFVTAFACVLDTQTGRVEYANAGHNPPWLRHGQERGWLQAKRGLVLGALDGYVYRSASIDLSPGDGLFLYTDGVTEAMNAQNELFGQGALEDALREADNLDTRQVVDHVLGKVERFVGDAPQADDITMLAFKWNLPVASISLPPDDRALDDLFDFIDKLCKQAQCSKKTRFDLMLVLEELFVNVAHYGFPEGQPRQSVHVEAAIDANAGVLHVTMSDAGIPYDPLAYQPQRVEAQRGEDNKVGGLGILLVRERTDGITYERIGGLNVLHLIKRVIE